MPTHRNINKCKYVETKADDRQAIATWQPYKQSNEKINKKKHKQKSKQQKQTMQQANVYMYSTNSSQWKKFYEVYCCVWKIVETVKC